MRPETGRLIEQNSLLILDNYFQTQSFNKLLRILVFPMTFATKLKQCWNMAKFKIKGASKNSALFHEGFARLFAKINVDCFIIQEHLRR